MADVVDVIPTYCTVGKVSEPNKVLEKYEDVVGSFYNTNKLVEAQANKLLRPNLKEVLRKYETTTINEDALLCKKAPNDEVVQFIALKSYRKTLLFDGQFPTSAGRPGSRRMYNFLGRSYHWPHAALHVKEHVSKGKYYRRHRLSQNQQKWLHLFSHSGPFEFCCYQHRGSTNKD